MYSLSMSLNIENLETFTHYQVNKCYCGRHYHTLSLAFQITNDLSCNETKVSLQGIDIDEYIIHVP